MNPEIIKAIERGVEGIREDVATYGTADVVAWCKWPLAGIASQTGDSLVSPYRQLVFVMSLLLETPEPAAPVTIQPEHWIRLCRQLNWLFLQYGPAFEPPRDATGKMDVRAFEKSLVATTTYLHYFNTGTIAHDTQLFRWYEGVLCPFDSELKAALGVSATELFAIYAFLGESIRGVDLTIWQRRMLKFAKLTNATGAIIASKFSIELSSLIQRFDAEITNAFWSRFCVKRGGVPQSTKYPTDPDHLESTPLIQISDEIALVTHFGAIFQAMVQRCVAELLRTAETRYLKRRDDFLESEVFRIFQTFFGSSAAVYASAFVDEFEHDVLVIIERRVLIVEAKAGAFKEPFRDVVRSVTRLKQNFDRVIQEGCTQGDRTASRLRNGETVEFSDHRREPLVTIRGADVDEVFVLCITADDFGPLALDLSLLLEKAADAPYPWVANFFDADTFLAAFPQIGLPVDGFFEFLRQRQHLHGRIICDDELELAGLFLQGGSLQQFDGGPGTKTLVPGDYSQIFDDLFFDEETENDDAE